MKKFIFDIIKRQEEMQHILDMANRQIDYVHFLNSLGIDVNVAGSRRKPSGGISQEDSPKPMPPVSRDGIIAMFNLRIEQSIHPNDAFVWTIGRELCRLSDTWEEIEHTERVDNALSRLTSAGAVESRMITKQSIPDLPSPSFVEHEIQCCGPVKDFLEATEKADREASGEKAILEEFKIVDVGAIEAIKKVGAYLRKKYCVDLGEQPDLFKNEVFHGNYRLTPPGMSYKAILLGLYHNGELDTVSRILEDICSNYKEYCKEVTMKALGYRLVVGGKMEIGVGTREASNEPASPESTGQNVPRDETAGSSETVAAVGNADATELAEIEPPEDLEALRRSLPNVPSGTQAKDGWIPAREFAEKVGYEMKTLRNCRDDGVKTEDKLFGRDTKGNIWGKKNLNSRTIFYRESSQTVLS